MKYLAPVCLGALLAVSAGSDAFGWGAVAGPRGGAAYRGPMGGAAVRTPSGAGAVRGPYGAGAVRGPEGNVAVRGPTYGGGAVYHGGTYYGAAAPIMGALAWLPAWRPGWRLGPLPEPQHRPTTRRLIIVPRATTTLTVRRPITRPTDLSRWPVRPRSAGEGGEDFVDGSQLVAVD